MGRKDKYADLVEPRLSEVSEWARAGATNAEMASALRISASTFDRYMQVFPDFKGAVNEGRRSGVAQVKGALLKLALGYEYDEKEINQVVDENGETKQTIKILKKQKHPDLNACIIYLRNCDPEYRDRDAWEIRIREAEMELKKASAEMVGFRCITG